MRRIAELGAFTNIVAGQTATLNLPVDRRYHNLKIQYRRNGQVVNRATMETDIKLIRLLLNGAIKWELTAKELFALLDIHGYPITSSVIPLHFSEPWRRSPQGEDRLAWALRGHARTFQVEIQLHEDAVTPSLDCYCEFDNEVAPQLIIRKLSRQQVPVATTGEHTLDGVPDLGNVHAIYGFEAAAGDIKSVRIERDGQIVYEVPRTIADETLKAHGGAPVSDVFAIRFDRSERTAHTLANRIDMGNGVRRVVPIRQKYDMKNASPFTQIIEYVGAAL